jgi:hypothetical protein
MSSPFPQGGRVFELPNQINQQAPVIQTNFVSLYVEAARLPRSSGWFSSDSTLGLSFKVIATYLTASGGLGTTSDQITVTKAYPFDVTRDGDGNVVLPLHSLPVVDTCPLMATRVSDKSYLSDLTANVTFLATRSSSGFGLALQEVFKLSGKLPIPNPFTQYVTLLGDGISDVVQAAQAQEANPQPLSTIAFQFVGLAASKSGYHVLLMSTDQDFEQGFVDINSLTAAQLSYDAVLGLTYVGVPCQNAHVIFRVAYTISPLPATVAGMKTEFVSHGSVPLNPMMGLREQALVNQLK